MEANLKVLRVADLNNDGLIDIVAGSLFGDKKGLISYINQGESFKPAVILDKITVRDLQLVDFDKDGKIDILTCGNIGNKRSITWWKNDLSGSNKFVPKVLINRDWHIDGLNVLDINKDGALDVVAALSYDSDDLPGGLSVYISNGNLENLTFIENKINDFPKDFLIESVLLKDMDNDGDQDFITYTYQYWVENRFKSSSSTETFSIDRLLLYPNPVTDFIQLNIDQEVELKLMSLTGEILLRKNIMPGDKTDISHLHIGQYFATITHINGAVKIIPFLKR